MRLSGVLVVGLGPVVTWLAQSRRLARRIGIVAVGLSVMVATGCTDSSAGPATVETMPASGVTETMATVEGSVSDPAEQEITYWFEYGETTEYGSETTTRSLEIERQGRP